MAQLDTEAQSHTTGERICVKRRDNTSSRESASTSVSPQHTALESERLHVGLNA